MASPKKAKAPKPADPKEQLKTRIEKAKTIFGKNKEKAGNDPKRRLALKKLKRAQRGLLRSSPAHPTAAAGS
jgi:hypothetical protein